MAQPRLKDRPVTLPDEVMTFKPGSDEVTMTPLSEILVDPAADLRKRAGLDPAHDAAYQARRAADERLKAEMPPIEPGEMEAVQRSADERLTGDLKVMERIVEGPASPFPTEHPFVI